MEFRLRERPVFMIKRAAGKGNRKLAEFLRKYGTGIDTGGVSHISGKGSRSEDAVFYAEGEKGIIGACSMLGYGRGLLLCYSFSVLKEFRREGVGTALIKDVINHARAAKIHNIMFLSKTSSKEARKFLKKTGFRKIGRIKRFFGNQDYFLWEYLP